MTTASITSKGQITIPADIRRYLSLNTGDRIEFLIESDGRVCFMPQTKDVQALKGMLKKPRKKVSIEDMNAAIANRGAQKG
ncbi:MAG: type II toxin-antitoxin system PrlF family antitoxin [Taibaiella sp.]|jgi:AbrB family looped-hinge helix DNA binding protein